MLVLTIFISSVLARIKAESPLCRYDGITYCHNCKKSYNIRRTTGNSIKKLYICTSQDVVIQVVKLAINYNYKRKYIFTKQSVRLNKKVN